MHVGDNLMTRSDSFLKTMISTLTERVVSGPTGDHRSRVYFSQCVEYQDRARDEENVG